MRTKQEITQDINNVKFYDDGDPNTFATEEMLVILIEVLVDIRDIMIKKEGLKLCRR